MLTQCRHPTEVEFYDVIRVRDVKIDTGAGDDPIGEVIACNQAAIDPKIEASKQHGKSRRLTEGGIEGHRHRIWVCPRCSDVDGSSVTVDGTCVDHGGRDGANDSDNEYQWEINPHRNKL